MLAMIGFGIGEITGGLSIGVAVDRLGSKKAILLNLLLIICTFTLTTSYIFVWRFNVLAVAMCTMWGAQDSGINTQVQEMLGFEFEASSSLPFSLYNIC